MGRPVAGGTADIETLDQTVGSAVLVYRHLIEIVLLVGLLLGPAYLTQHIDCQDSHTRSLHRPVAYLMTRWFGLCWLAVHQGHHIDWLGQIIGYQYSLAVLQDQPVDHRHQPSDHQATRYLDQYQPVPCHKHPSGRRYCSFGNLALHIESKPRPSEYPAR